MKKFIKAMIMSIAFCVSAVHAGHYTPTFTITSIEVLRNQGALIKGNLGNPAACTINNYLFIPKSHPQYDQMYSTVLAAYMGNKKIVAYAHKCEAVGWHWDRTKSVSTVTKDGTITIQN